LPGFDRTFVSRYLAISCGALVGGSDVVGSERVHLTTGGPRHYAEVVVKDGCSGAFVEFAFSGLLDRALNTHGLRRGRGPRADARGIGPAGDCPWPWRGRSVRGRARARRCRASGR